MQNKNSFVLQTRLNAVVTKLSDKQAGVLFKSILNYAENGTLEGFEDSAVAIAFEFVRQDLDYAAQKYAETCARRAESGRLGGKAKQANLANASKCKQTLANCSKAKHIDIDNDIDIEQSINTLPKEKIIKKEISQTRFKKPSIEEICAYCLERNNAVNPQAFFDFYESKGWKIGNTPMKDWRAAVRTWERNSKGEQNVSTGGKDYNREPEPNKYAGFGRTISADDN